MKKLLMLFFLPWIGHTSGQIPRDYRDEYNLQRHEERLRAAGVLVTDEMREYVRDSGRLSVEQKKDLSAFVTNADPLQIEWLVCESGDAFLLATSIEKVSPRQLSAFSQAFVDYTPSRVVAGGAEQNIIWNVPPLKLANKLAAITGFEPPGERQYFSREGAVQWLIKAVESYLVSDNVSPEMQAAGKSLLASLKSSP